ncbi:MAG: sialidase family protein [Methyloprofundus sp.]|nr:sialidase family protein [Methyloprofundus sp.]
MIYKLLLFSLLFLLGLASAQATTSTQQNNPSVEILKNSLALTFSTDGTLWRVLPSAEFVFVDYSKDLGLSYSQPVKVNKKAQKISAWAENPPAIKVSKAGRIYILYYVDEQQKSTSYFSYSDDFGRSFSASRLISDHAATAMHYMDKMLLDKQDNVHFFWHDKRDQDNNAALGTGALSLYHAKSDGADKGALNNSLVSHAVCSCCRSAVSLSSQNLPVILMRMVFADGARDHALLTQNTQAEWSVPRHISDDHWVIDACPEHGPALAIDEQDRSHLTWFSLGNKRQGIFYAQTDDYGTTVSQPIAIGQIEFLPSHPDVISLNSRVVLAWTEFNGKETSLYIQQSDNRGNTWQAAKKIFDTLSTAGHPQLLAYKERIFISWMTHLEGHRFIEVSK